MTVEMIKFASPIPLTSSSAARGGMQIYRYTNYTLDTAL